ncbi:MAG: hypothetical protein DWQ36_12690 [Acidobacteria bacterium]|nr:MAG: hypothetical protein DWQ30_08850 [Acidobacteriota bacterium]REK07187.1 MAG: hypothetical protein DWQ36_12690 [Acidobacteriota bacterium]
MKTNPDLDALEENIKRLKLEYDRYFVGANDLPPVHFQEALLKTTRDLRGRVRGSIDRFRLSSLEARLNSFVEMFNRRVRAVEEGRERRGGLRMDYEPPKHDPMTGIRISGDVGEAEAAALYRPLFESSPGARKVDLVSFQAYLQKQSEQLRSKTGCRAVSFRLTREAGQLKLKAKPVNDPG